MIQRAARIGHSPNQCGQRPEEGLEVSTGERHPQALGLLGKQPGIANVAIKRGLEINQEEADLPNPAPKVFASQPVRKLVRADDPKADEPRQSQRFEPEQGNGLMNNLRPINHADDGRANDERR